MAVAKRRPGFALWIAWVGAGALGASVAASATQPGQEVFGDTGASYWVPILLATPLALLQFLVLRGLIGVSVVAAGMWIGLTLVASAASIFAISGWYFVVPQLVPRTFISIETGMDIMFTGGEYINPLLLGLAQGVALAWVFGRAGIAAWWVVINLVAYAVSLQLTIFALTALAIEPGTTAGNYVLPRVSLAALYAAVTGLALVAIVSMQYVSIKAHVSAASKGAV